MLPHSALTFLQAYCYYPKTSLISTYLVVEEEQSTEEAVQVSREQGEVDGSRTGFLYHHWHEAVEAKHTGTKANIQQACRRETRSKVTLQPAEITVLGGRRLCF